MSAISDAWARIESWGRANASEMLRDLNPGATRESLDEFRQALGQPVPESFLESLRIHDGESDGWPSRVFADMGAYLGSDRIVEQWRMRVRPAAYDEAWIPFMDCNGDVFWALDLAPREGGTPGQVIQVDLEGCEWKVIADSFEAFMTDYANRLVTEEWKFRDGVPTKFEL